MLEWRLASPKEDLQAALVSWKLMTANGLSSSSSKAGRLETQGKLKFQFQGSQGEGTVFKPHPSFPMRPTSGQADESLSAPFPAPMGAFTPAPLSNHN